MKTGRPSKVTAAQVESMRLLHTLKFPIMEIGKLYDVHHATVLHHVRRAKNDDRPTPQALAQELRRIADRLDVGNSTLTDQP